MDLVSTSASMHMLYTEAYQKIIDSLFSKCMRLDVSESDDEYDNSEISFESAITALTEIQDSLNTLKAQIPSDEMEKWRRHTWLTNPTKKIPFHLSHIYNIEYCTRAFLKFYEILFHFPNLIVDNTVNNELFRTLHLCEGPGAFISALNVYILLNKDIQFKNKWMWYANSLNPHFECNEPSSLFLDDELITATQDHWIFGPDNSGNILHWDAEYLLKLQSELGSFHLVTADGSLYCQDDPKEQEALTFPLIKQEIEIAKLLLTEGGSLVVKIYTFTSEYTVKFLKEITELFQSIHLLKPSCSKPGNSEVYMICEGYTKHQDLRSHAKSGLFKNILRCAQFFAEHQKDMLQFNLVTFPITKEILFSQTIRRKQDEVLQKFGTYLEISLFNEIELDSWLTSSDIFANSCRLECSNPWNYRHMHGQVESLRNISSDLAISEINKMLFQACLLGDFDCPKQTFRIELCSLCQDIKYIQKQVKVASESSCVVTAISMCTSNSIRQSLFLDLRTLVLLNSTDVEYTDFCDVSAEREVQVIVSVEKASSSADNEENENSSVTEESFVIKKEEDWFKFLKKLCTNDITVAEVLCHEKEVLILTRFSASVFVILTTLFEEVFIELDASAHVTLTCWKQNLQVRHPIWEIIEELEALYSSSAVTRRILQFVPFQCFRCQLFYTSVRAYNTKAAIRICSQRALGN